MGDVGERLASLLEKAGVGVNEIDARTGAFVQLSQRFCDLLGYTREELIGRTPLSITLPDDATRDAAPVSQLADGTLAIWSTEKRFLRRDGSVVWARVHVSGADRGCGKHTLLALIEDITEKRRADAALRESEARSRALIDQAADAMLVHDGDGRFVDVNRRACETLGYSREELLALTVPDVETDFDLPAAKKLWARIVPGEPHMVCGHHRRKDGTTFPVEVSFGAFDLGGRRLFLGLAHDVTERERAKVEAAARERHIATVLRTTPSGIIVTRDRDRVIIDVNDTFVELFGWSREELLGRTVPEIGLYFDADARARVLEEYSRTGVVTRMEVAARHKSGAVSECILTAGTIEIAGERCAVAFWEDVSELHRRDAALRVQTTALQAAGNGIVITDTSGIVQWVNEAFTRLTGYEAAEVLGASPRVLRSGAQSTEFYREMWTTILDGRIWRGELVNRRKDGSLYNEDMTVTPVRDSQGVVSHFIAIKQDVTERKRHETALAQAEERHRLALDAAELGTWVFQVTAGVLKLDERAQRHCGVTRPDISLEEMFARVHPDDVAEVRAMVAAVHSPSGTGRAAFEHRFVHPSGDVRWVSIHVRVEFEGEGAARAVRFSIATSQDITQAKSAAEALQAGEERYRSLVDNLDELVFSIDLEGKLTFVSQGIARFGYRPEEMVGRPMYDFVHPEDRARLGEDFASRIAGAEPGPVELRWLDAAGKVRILRETARRHFVRGRLAGLTGLATDITLQRDTEEQLRAAQRMEAVGRLAGGVAHDFNNMLSVILSYTELAIQDLKEDDPMRADLCEVAAAGKRAEGLTRQLLAFSRRQVLLPESVDLGALVDGVSKMLRRLIGEDVALHVSAAPGLFTTKVDRGQLEQVVMNLAVNARDAMPTGGQLRIHIRNTTVGPPLGAALEVPPGEFVELTVADTGSGMPPEVRARIFEPFYTTKGLGKGTGLGLSMVHGIVKQSGGGITVDTKPGSGTTFHIFLPRYVGPASAMQTRPGIVGRKRGHERVLLVEDEDALRNVVKRVLVAAGYTVYPTADAAEALLVCKQLGSQVDIVLTDVVMPGMSGREMAELLAPMCPTAKVIFMSGYTDEMLEHYGVLGQRFLRKPFDIETLASTVRNVIDEDVEPASYAVGT